MEGIVTTIVSNGAVVLGEDGQTHRVLGEFTKGQNIEFEPNDSLSLRITKPQIHALENSNSDDKELEI